MVLQNIDKAIYRKHLNWLIGVSVVALFAITFGVSTSLIYLIGDPGGSNFVLNLAGVCCAAAVVGSTLYRVRSEPFMSEVWYVWRLKQELNAIYRQSKALNKALEQNNNTAFVIKYYHVKASIQVYELDDNTLTISQLKADLHELEERIQALGLHVSVADYHRDLLKTLSDTSV
jgi:Protein of unknown function (DUF3087)